MKNLLSDHFSFFSYTTTMKAKFLMILFLMFCFFMVNAQGLSVMTYNIRLDTESDGENQWGKRKDFLIGQIQFHEPMVFGVQEALPNQMDDLNKFLTDYESIGVGREDGKRKGEFSAIFYQPSKLKLKKSGTFWLSETPEKVSTGWDAALPRICTWAVFRLKKQKKNILVMNTHFDHVGVIARQKSMELMLVKAKEINDKHLPLIVMGDLNLEPDSGPIQWFSSQLTDSRLAAADKAFGPEGTFNGWNIHEPVHRRIDYIFFSEDDFQLNKYAVLSDFVNMHYASDHFPVFINLSLN